MNINNWHDLPWKTFHEEVSKSQDQLVMAHKTNNRKLVYQLQRKLVVSLAARALATRRVVSNQGSSTPGVDKHIWDTQAKRYKALAELREITHRPNSYVASPLRRVHVPKPNTTEKRPLGIPTMTDRAVQAVYHLALDPIVEAESDPNSYGFRLYRSTHDAITRIRTLLDKRYSPTWILDADVAKCFDTTSHDFLPNQTMIYDKHMLEQWLKSGTLEGGITKETTMGTPQGRVISPLLCNVALNGIEETAINAVPRFATRGVRSKVHLTGYADDFVCTGPSKQILEEKIKPAIRSFLESRGLQFKDSKTQIIHIDQGFNLLGFSIKSQPWSYKLNARKVKQGLISDPPRKVLIITPRKDKVVQLKDKIRQLMVPDRPIESIVRDLNPVLRGWSEYYRISYHSLSIFGALGHYIWEKMWTWARKRGRQRSAKWLYKKYVISKINSSQKFERSVRKWRFGLTTSQVVFDISTVTHWKVTPIKQGLNPYLQVNKRYYENRKRVSIEAKFRAAIYRRFNHICPHCGQSLHNGEPIELHHVIPAKVGGQWSMENIQPLHRVCHQSVTHAKILEIKPAEETAK